MEDSRDPVFTPFNRNHPTEYRVSLAKFLLCLFICFFSAL